MAKDIDHATAIQKAIVNHIHPALFISPRAVATAAMQGTDSRLKAMNDSAAAGENVAAMVAARAVPAVSAESAPSFISM